VVRVIYYLHHECDPPIIHRDITSGNILLDANFKPFVSDFVGTARTIKVRFIKRVEPAWCSAPSLSRGSDPKSIGSISMNQFSSNLVDASRNWRLHGRKGLWPDGKMHLKCWAGPGSTPTPRTRLFVRQRLKAVYRKKKHTATWHPVRASMVRQKMWCLQFRCSNNRGSIRKATWDFLTNKISCLRKSCIKCLHSRK
jgi:hypothetical protein